MLESKTNALSLIEIKSLNELMLLSLVATKEANISFFKIKEITNDVINHADSENFNAGFGFLITKKLINTIIYECIH